MGRREIVTLTGPNGGGKYILLGMLLGLRQPNRVNLRLVKRLTIDHLTKRISVDPTMPLTVERMLGLTNSVDRETWRAELQVVGAGHLADAMISPAANCSVSCRRERCCVIQICWF